ASTDLTALPRSKKKNTGHKLIEAEMLYSFDLAEGPLFRVHLLRLTKREQLLLITMHGIIVDGWSIGVLVDEIFSLYDAFCTGAASPLAPLSSQFADFAQWQRRWQPHPEIAAQLAYWREQLREPLPVMRFSDAPSAKPIDRFQTARREVLLPASLSEAA